MPNCTNKCMLNNTRVVNLISLIKYTFIYMNVMAVQYCNEIFLTKIFYLIFFIVRKKVKTCK